jgi:hypothetical protein
MAVLISRLACVSLARVAASHARSSHPAVPASLSQSFQAAASMRDDFARLLLPVAVISAVGVVFGLLTGTAPHMVAVLTIGACGLSFTKYLAECVIVGSCLSARVAPARTSPRAHARAQRAARAAAAAAFHAPRASHPRSWVISKDAGTAEMRKVSDPIREGSEGFLRVQYGAIARIAALVAVLIFVSYKLRPENMGTGVDSLGSNVLGLIGALSFGLVRGNARVGRAARPGAHNAPSPSPSPSPPRRARCAPPPRGTSRCGWRRRRTCA